MKERKKKETIAIEFDVEYDEVEWKGDWIPKTVYKYRDWNDKWHRKILEENSVYVPDSFGFNDPFDCNIPISYDLLSKDDDMAEKFIRRVVYGSRTDVNDTMEREVQLQIKTGQHKDEEFLKTMKSEILKQNREKHGVLCLTPVNDNLLMWAHYANSHKGFCVGFNSTKLFDYFGGGSRVTYLENFPVITPLDEREKQYFLQFHTKSTHWAYEIEYRLMTFPKANHAITIPNEIVSEVIFGAKMPTDQKEQIKELVISHYPQAQIFTCVPDTKAFKINIVPEINNSSSR